MLEALEEHCPDGALWESAWIFAEDPWCAHPMLGYVKLDYNGVPQAAPSGIMRSLPMFEFHGEVA